MISFAEAIIYVFSHNFLRFLSLLHTYQRWKGRAWLVMMARVMFAHSSFNPLSPNIHIQILQTDLHTSTLRISRENLIKDHGIFSMVIILLILITLSLDSVWILLGEN